MDWSTEVITSFSSDTEPAIMITFCDSKYMFNTSENTMRSFLQSGRVWRRTKCLFFTQARIEKISGLPGLIMTFADATINKLQLIGPSGLNHLLASMRLYTFRDSIALQSSEIPWTTNTDPKPCFTDKNVTVYSIPAVPSHEASLSPSSPEPIPETTMDSEGNVTEAAGKRKRDLSADTPRKRLNAGNELSADSEINESESTNLSDQAAHAYSQRIIQHMFPGTNIPSPQEVAESNRSGVVSSTFFNGDIEDQQKKLPAPPRFWKQLPKFTCPLSHLKTPPTMSYLVLGPQYRGKFDAAKSIALGVPKGPARGKLAKGDAVTIEVEVNGEKVQRTIYPDDVLGKPDPRGAILILDVPTPEHILSLLSAFQNTEFYRNFWSEDASCLAATGDPKFALRTIYQTCGEGVLEDERYKAFLRGFGPGPNHIVASREYCPDPITFTSVSQNHLRLSRLDDKIFPVPKYSLTPKKDISTIIGLPAKLQLMASNLQNSMRPWSAPAPDASIVAMDKFHPFVNGSQSLELSSQLQRCIRRAQKAVSEVIASGEIQLVEGADVGIVTLGTSGSLPSKHRNVLSTLVRVPGWGNILLDAGEGTWGQLARMYGLDGPDSVWQTLRDLKCIFISHLHADHHVGLAQILLKRRQIDPPPSEPLYIVTIRNVHLYLRELQDVQDIGIDDPSGNGIIPVLSESIHFRQLGAYVTTGRWQIGGNEPWLEYNKSADNGRKMCEALGLEYFKTVDVAHHCRSFGASFRHKDGWSITFSGDTSPSDSLREVGMNSTVLIHEATMGDDELELARRKAHSTIGQAIAQGEAMNAKNTLLTHFSARYPQIPSYLIGNRSLLRATPTSYKQDKHIVPAFDYLNLTIGDMWKIQFYLKSMVQAINKENADLTLSEDESDSSS